MGRLPAHSKFRVPHGPSCPLGQDVCAVPESVRRGNIQFAARHIQCAQDKMIP